MKYFIRIFKYRSRFDFVHYEKMHFRYIYKYFDNFQEKEL